MLHVDLGLLLRLAIGALEDDLGGGKTNAIIRILVRMVATMN